MLKDIIQRLAEDTGYNLEQDRTILVNLVHRAAEQVYKRLECNAIMREVTVLVPSNKVIALPSLIGPLRGMRESETDLIFPLHTQFAPRFVKSDWQFKWMNWRELRQSPIHTDLNVIAPLRLDVAAVETDEVTVHVVGQTNNGAKVSEEVTMDDVSKSTTNSFGPTIHSIACFDTRVNNITVYDDDDNEIAVLYNNENKTSYKLIDVSEFKWAKDLSDENTTIEILYKQPYYKMLNDADEFAADGYDETLYFQAMALWAAPQQGKEGLATLYASQALVEPQANKNHQEQHQEKKIQFGRSPHYGAIRRYNGGIPIFNNPRIN